MRTYTMTPAQSDDWTLGGAAADAVAQELVDCFQAVALDGTVLVLVDDGSVAFTLELQ